MHIKIYLEESELSITRLAKKLGITFNQMYYLLRGGRPTIKTALTIEKFTEGKVKPVDFLSEHEKYEIYGEEQQTA